MSKWQNIPCSLSSLDIGVVLNCGQSFRWNLLNGYWLGVFKGRVWKLKQEKDFIWYKVLNNPQTKLGKRKKKTETSLRGKKSKIVGNIDGVFTCHGDDCCTDKEILQDYFQLRVNLTELCDHWCKVDQHFADIQKKIPGVRMLRQDPVENLFSFICSSNNNITRISSMIEKMCQTFGKKLMTIDGKEYYAFPEIHAITDSNAEATLRKLGFGYRAKYIHQTSLKIMEYGGEDWLHSLRTLPYKDAHAKLVTLPGIGAKVADCICMMSLDKFGAIPVDTHVWQIAVRDYKIKTLMDTKTLTKSSYKAIGDHFRDLWGPYAAWAMNFLFAADLKQFQNRTKTSRPIEIKQ